MTESGVKISRPEAQKELTEKNLQTLHSYKGFSGNSRASSSSASSSDYSEDAEVEVNEIKKDIVKDEVIITFLILFQHSRLFCFKTKIQLVDKIEKGILN